MDILEAQQSQQRILQHGNAPADTVLRVCSLRFVRFFLTTEQHTESEHCWQKACPIMQQAPLYKKSNCTDLWIGSMCGIFTYIWLIFMVNVGEYTIHGSYGYGNTNSMTKLRLSWPGLRRWRTWCHHLRTRCASPGGVPS